MINRQHKLTIIAAAWCLMMTFACPQPAHGQGNAQKANQLFAEGIELFETGTVESLQTSLAKFEKACQIYYEINVKESLAVCLVFIGDAYDALEDRSKAIECYARALAIKKSINDKTGEAATLGRIGRAYIAIDENQQALEYIMQSLQISRIINDKGIEGSALSMIGTIHSRLGEKQKALEYYTQSLQSFKDGNNKQGEAITLSKIGLVYGDLGENQKALTYFLQALPIAITIGDKRDRAVTLINIGATYSDLGENQKALEYYMQALPLITLINDKALILNNIGKAYSELGELSKALEYYKQAISFRRVNENKSGEIAALNNAAAIFYKLGNEQVALSYYLHALSLCRIIGDKSSEAKTFSNIMMVLGSLDNQRYAALFGKLSVNTRQLLRSKITGLDKNVQQAFLKSFEHTYRNLAEILIANNRLAEAQQVLNLFKDQQYFDLNSTKQTAPLALASHEIAFISLLDRKLDSIAAMSNRLDELRRINDNGKLTKADITELRLLEADLQKARTDYPAFFKTAEKEFAAPPDGKDKFPAVADLTQLQTALRELSAQTGEKSVAVYTLVGEENYRALVVTSDSISSVSSPIKGAALNQKAQQLWRLLRTPQYDPQPLAKEIYDVVFAPLAAKLPADTKTILWSLDGSLRYLPMAALHDGKQYLVERYNNVVFTRADKERLTRAVSANLTGTGLGGSEAHKVTLGNQSFNAAALPFVRTELARIFKNSSSTTGVLSGEVLLDARFTRSAMISTLQKRRPLVHIASHFKFEAGDEANSFLLLGDGSPFTLDEMKRQKDLFAGVELLALSACETAAQREGSNGREVDGFAELAQRLGAGAVMASLWEVSDDSTAELMARFYKTYNSQTGANKATALRSAQLALLRGEYKPAGAANRRFIEEDTETAAKIKIDSGKLKPFKAAKIAPFAHPFYWSPFILIGNWK